MRLRIALALMIILLSVTACSITKGSGQVKRKCAGQRHVGRHDQRQRDADLQRRSEGHTTDQRLRQIDQEVILRPDIDQASPASTRAGLSSTELRRERNPSTTPTMRAATPYTMHNSQYLVAPSTAPRKMP
jgi:hypothetical protein